MYKCSNCGNTEKFVGFAAEKGNVYIYQDNNPGYPKKNHKNYSWIYMISDNSWESNINIKKCFYCSSCKIVKIK